MGIAQGYSNSIKVLLSKDEPYQGILHQIIPPTFCFQFDRTRRNIHFLLEKNKTTLATEMFAYKFLFGKSPQKATENWGINGKLAKETCGASGYIANTRYNSVVAKVQIIKDEDDSFFKNKEAAILAYLNLCDPDVEFVPRLWDVFPESKSNVSTKRHVIVMEKLEKDLYTSAVSREKTLSLYSHVFVDLCKSIQFLHNHGIYHGDIRLKNISNKTFDFGLSEVLMPGQYVRKLKTARWFRAPEIVLGLESNHKADIFSMGCVLFELYTGNPFIDTANNNFDQDNIDHLASFHMRFEGLPDYIINSRVFLKYAKINPQNGCYRLSPSASLKTPNKTLEDSLTEKLKQQQIGPTRSLYFIDLLYNMLMLDPKKRFTADQVVNHPFFKQIKDVLLNSVIINKKLTQLDAWYDSINPDNFPDAEFSLTEIIELPIESVFMKFHGIHNSINDKNTEMKSKFVSFMKEVFEARNYINEIRGLPNEKLSQQKFLYK